MEKPKLILELEAELNCNFELVDLNDLRFYISKNKPVYSVDKIRNISGIGIRNDLVEIPKAFSNNVLSLNCLVKLNLNYNEIENISSLKSLKTLQTLYLTGNKVYNIDALKELKYLQELNLMNNPIQFLSNWITEFPEMDIHWKSDYVKGFITFYNNPIEIPPIEVIKRGKGIIKSWFDANDKKLYEDRYISYKKPKEILQLEKELNLRIERNDIHSMNITSYIGINSVTFYDDIYLNIIGLHFANITMNTIPAIVSNCKHLKYIRVNNCNVDDISAIADLQELEEIHFSGNKIKSVEAFKHLFNLSILDLSYNEINNINDLIELSNLKELNLYHNPVYQTSYPKKIKKFKKNKKILELEKLVGFNLKQLKEIPKYNNNAFLKFERGYYLHKNKIIGLFLSDINFNDIGYFENFPDLCFLDIGNNNIHDITAICNLTMLSYSILR